jgi:hypothetical protein
MSGPAAAWRRDYGVSGNRGAIMADRGVMTRIRRSPLRRLSFGLR